MSGVPTGRNIASTGRRPSLVTAILAMLAIGAMVLSGCASNSSMANTSSTDKVPVPVLVDNPEPQLPTTIKDSAGDEHTITDTSRIVSLNGGISETLISMGMQELIVGKDVTSDVAELADVPEVSNGHDISAESLLSLNPSLVIGDARSGPPEAIDAVRKAGVPVVIVPEVWSLSELPPRVDAIAAAIGTPGSAQVVNDYISQGVSEAAATINLPESAKSESDSSGKPVIAFLYLRGTAAVYLLGGDKSGADDLIEGLGAIDAGSKSKLASFTPLTPEALAAAQPDVILVMDKGLESVGGVDGLIKLPGVGQTPAGKNKRILSMPDTELLSYGPRTPDTLERIASKLNELYNG